MRQSAQLLFALAAAITANPLPQAVTSAVSPTAAIPTSCATSFSGTFGMAIATMSAAAAPTTSATTQKRLVERKGASEVDYLNSAPRPVARAIGDSFPTACASNDTLQMVLSDGVMKDAHGRTASIVANRQFQFDDPPQAGAIYTAGWSVCDDGNIGLGASETFYQCLSGTFYNLYDESIGGQCEPVQMQVIRLQDCGASGASTAA